MISHENLHSIGKITASVFRKAGEMLLEKQYSVADNTYLSRTGALKAKLASKPIQIQSTEDNASMVIDYLFYTRLLDLRYTRHGKKKERFAPIYNKYVWGFLVGYTYNNLRWSLIAHAKMELDETSVTIKI